MMTKKKILVLTDKMPWGHRSIAKAIFTYLKEKEKEGNYEVVYSDVKQEAGIIEDLYIFAYKYAPFSNKIAHEFLHNDKVRELILKKFLRLNLPRLKKEVEKINPDLIISTYFFHTHSLVWWREKERKKFKLWTVVADPWTINLMSFIKGADLHLVYDKTGLNLAIKNGIKRENILETGWWVREHMYQKFDKFESRKKLGFDDDRPVIFVGGGSLGTNSLSKLLPIMLTLKKKVGFVINTGTDKLSYNLIEHFLEILKKLRKDNLILVKNMGWIENMAEILSACDIVFGKAGPNFLFDCVACKKPFVAITHIGGQEDGNIDLIKKKKLGWIKEKADEANKFLLEYLDKPEFFENKYKKEIKKESLNNKKSMGIILDRIKSDLRL